MADGGGKEESDTRQGDLIGWVIHYIVTSLRSLLAVELRLTCESAAFQLRARSANLVGSLLMTEIG